MMSIICDLVQTSFMGGSLGYFKIILQALNLKNNFFKCLKRFQF